MAPILLRTLRTSPQAGAGGGAPYISLHLPTSPYISLDPISPAPRRLALEAEREAIAEERREVRHEIQGDIWRYKEI